MLEKYFIWSIQLLAFGFLFVMFLFIPKLARRGIVFGIRVPAGYAGEAEISRIITSYTKRYIAINIPIICLAMWMSVAFDNAWVNLAGTIVFILVSFFVYYQAREKTATLKNRQGWYSNKKQVAVTDTGLLGKNRKRTVVSQWWFLIPTAIVALNFHILNISGDSSIASYIGANILSVLFPYGIYEIIKRARLEIDASDLGNAIERTVGFRKRWTGFMVFGSIVSGLLLTLHESVDTRLLTLGDAAMKTIDFTATVLFLLVAAILTFQAGQGGSRLRIGKTVEQEREEVDRDDDSYWKLGLLYFNPDDSAWFVEKRSGMGWTANWAKIPAILIVVCLIGLVPALCRLLGL
jgi:uncharacterized membrane protein